MLQQAVLIQKEASLTNNNMLLVLLVNYTTLSAFTVVLLSGMTIS